MAGEITLPQAVQESNNYGSELRVSAVIFDVKSERAEVIYETHDGVNFTGKHFRVTIDKDGSTYHYTDGTSERLALPKFNGPGPQGVIDWMRLKQFAEVRAR